LKTTEQRLFFALWPDDGVREALSHVVDSLSIKRGRPVAVSNLHLTLVFLGNTDLARRNCAERIAARTEATRFHLFLDYVGYWRRPQIVWAGASITPEPLLALVRQLNAGVTECGFAPDSREYRVHVTLARKVHSGPRVPIDPIAWWVERFCLVESLTDRSGVCYQVLQSWELR
jgi:2'-5' RNA ligase